MSISVVQLLENSVSEYNMNCVAGQNGLDNLVEWVHIVEDIEVADFLHGYEFVFTAGYLNKSKDWLYQFVQVLYKAKVSALVVNIGPYIDKIPDDAIKFCNEVDFPLYTIPWKMRLVDVTRDLSKKIIQNERKEENVAHSMKNIIFHTGNLKNDIQVMERYGYSQSSHICFFNITLLSVKENEHIKSMEILKKKILMLAKKNQHTQICFTYNENLVIALFEKNMYNVKNFLAGLIEQLELEGNNNFIRIGVSDILQGFEVQGKNFEKSVQANYMAKCWEKTIVYYDQLGIYKILLGIKDKGIMKKYYNETLHPLEKYDSENNTKLMDFLKIYLECNGSPQIVAGQTYIHRNTVSNYVKKIEKITNCNLLNAEDRVRCNMALIIKELI